MKNLGLNLSKSLSGLNRIGNLQRARKKEHEMDIQYLFFETHGLKNVKKMINYFAETFCNDVQFQHLQSCSLCHHLSQT